MGTIFAMEIGTEGTGPNRWSIWFPIRLAPPYQVEPGSKSLNGRSISFQPRGGLNVVEVCSFGSECEAKDFLQRIRGALMLWGVERGVGLVFPNEMQTVQLFEPPAPGIDNPNFGAICKKVGWEKVDGFYDLDKPAILPQHKRLIRFVMGQAKMFVTGKAERVIWELLPSLLLGNIDSVPSSGKLALAIETYLSSLFVIGEKARLLELTTVLEILAPRSGIGPQATDVLSALLIEASRRRDAVKQNVDKYREIDRLVNRVGNLDKDSIKDSLRTWTRDVCTRLEGRDPDGEAAHVARYYDVRSHLVHSGSAEDQRIRDALAWLTKFVPEVLALLIKEAASAA